MCKDSPDVFDDVETEEEECNHEEDEQEDDDEDVGEDDEYSSDASDAENGERPWKKLRFEVIDDLSSNYDEQVEEVAEAKASNYLLPAYRKKLQACICII